MDKLLDLPVEEALDPVTVGVEASFPKSTRARNAIGCGARYGCRRVVSRTFPRSETTSPLTFWMIRF